MWLGVDYYPEQWEQSLMAEDLDNIVELGCNVIRIGEFAWHRMEPTEGAYDFSFFDNVIEEAGKRGLSVIMGTPTAAIPAWLAAKHPEILSEFEDGRKRTFGGRHVYCFNSPVLYAYSEKLIRAQAEHYRDEKRIVAWQLDNEFGHEGSDLCTCDQCRNGFRKYLSQRFGGSIDRLNEAYGTSFWSQEYNSFEEIPVPTETITTHNPALRLDWERFRSRSIEAYSNFQRDLLKSILLGAVVIHDFPGGGLEKHCDYAQVAKKLDVAAFNNYPVWGGQKEPIRPHEIAFGLDYIRGLKRQNFWITEAIMGAQGHDVTGFLPRPNQAKLWSCQGMARGASSLIYFRYRGGTKGAEQFCYGILDADNRKKRKYYETKSFLEEIAGYQEELETPIESRAAMIYDYDSLAAFRIQRQSLLLDCQEEMKKLYKPFYDANVMVDVIPSDMDFSGYRVIVLPLMIVGKEEFRERVIRFAENGGIVVMTYRTSVKDVNNNLTLGRVLPVGYDRLAGVTVDDTESLQELAAFPICGQGTMEGRRGTGGIFRDMLIPQGAEVLYRYDDPFYRDYGAITRNRTGRGCVYYLGCSPDETTLRELMLQIIEEGELNPHKTGEGIECVYRGEGKNRIRILMNHNAVETEAEGVKLEPFGYRIERCEEC